MSKSKDTNLILAAIERLDSRVSVVEELARDIKNEI